MSGELRGRVVALVGRGTEFDRRVAVLCAEAGASIALGTVADTKEQEFAMNSIANETWSIGVENFVRQMYSWNAVEAEAFVDQCEDRMGPCDVLVVDSSVWSHAPFEELTEDEWENTFRGSLTAPFMLAQAFGRRMNKRGAGLILIVAPARPDADVAERTAHGGLRALAAWIAAWGERDGVRCRLLEDVDALAVDAGARVVYAEILGHCGGNPASRAT